MEMREVGISLCNEEVESVEEEFEPQPIKISANNTIFRFSFILTKLFIEKSIDAIIKHFYCAK
jgi:hypothetical protein